MMGCARQLLVVVTLLLAADGRAGQFDIVPYAERFVALPYATMLCLDKSAATCDVLVDDDADPRDRAGLRRDTWYFLGYQVAALGILYVAPESMSGWSDEQKEDYGLSEWWDNVTHPTWDEDDYAINYRTTCMNRFWKSDKWRLRKSQIVRCCGKLSAPSTRNGTSSSSFLAILRDEKTPVRGSVRPLPLSPGPQSA